MQILKKQIRETFFNPILYFLPILTFIIVKNSTDVLLAWKISFPVALGLYLYVYAYYRNIIVWYSTITIVYLLASIMGSIGFFLNVHSLFLSIMEEGVFLLFLLLLLLFKLPTLRIIQKTLPYQFSSLNNFYELRRIAISLFLVSVFYAIFVLIVHVEDEKDIAILSLGNRIYILLIALVVVYEGIRVYTVRREMLKENWLPIVDARGRIMGSVQERFSQDTDYFLPKVRLVVIGNGRVLLEQKQKMWDTPLSDYVQIGETVEEALYRVVRELEYLKDISPVFLSSYHNESQNKNYHNYLFVVCLSSRGMVLSPIPSQKWWTVQQLKDNLKQGIFSSDFVKEYDYVSRSGILSETGCNCECLLRDTVLIRE